MARTVGSTGEKTARSIVQSAIKLFAKRGYAAVSMRAIAQEIGITVGALYNHFKTKQDVLMFILHDHMDNVTRGWIKADDVNLTPSERLERFVRYHVRFHMEHHEEVFISFMELRSVEAQNFTGVELIRQAYEYMLRDILIEGMQRGEFTIEDAHVSAMALLAMMTGVTIWYKPDGRLSADEIEEIYVSMVFQTVGISYAQTEEIKKAV